MTVRAIGAVPLPLLREVARAVTLRLGVKSRVETTPMRLASDAYRPQRQQYRADMLLDDVDARVPEGEALLGVVGEDIYEPGMNFLFGISYEGRGSALLSIARVDEGERERRASAALRATRAAKLAVHEVGHSLGLGHCRTPRCVMSYSDHVAELDSESDRLCARCRERLRRLQAT